MTDRIAELLAEEKRLSTLLRSTRDELRDLRAKVASVQLGVAVGDHVVCKDARYVVSRIDGDYSGWLYGRKITKSGAPSKAEQCLYRNWKKEQS